MGKICEFFSGKNVLVTGATGFCGKVLVEKLIRDCEQIGKIFIIVRQKKNATAQERYSDYVNHFVFDTIRKSKNSSFLKKITLISGDITLDGLNISKTDEETLINEVNIIFHCAANVRFNESLKDALNINVSGTLRLTDLALKMKHLEVFSYMSTAFSQSYQLDLEEKHYPTNLDIIKLIKNIQEMDEAGVSELEIDLLKKTKHPNTYTLTKAMAEDVLHVLHKELPIVIVRPSQVWWAIKEPMKGYIEGLNTGMSIVAGGMTGLVRSMYAGKDAVAKLTPVDYLINATIVSAWKRSTIDKLEGVLFFNCSDAKENPLLWSRSIEISEIFFPKYAPYEKLLWYPHINYTSSYLWHMISQFLFQLLPAIFFDLLRILSGDKPMFTRIQRKIINGISVLYYFTERNFLFKTEKLQNLFADLDFEEKEKFDFDHFSIDWIEHHDNGIRETRRLLLGDDESTMPKAQEKLRKLYWADWTLKVVLFGLFLWYFIRVAELISNYFEVINPENDVVKNLIQVS